ncbi:Protein of unknown function [Jatrophihabitans endophyticus]|uniref:DUF4229 domain-containing protein n=1 Tax=Jatrophihabitans endophyticus TaxID=1206085 RepID=A0A1M5R1M0_9ACTN|nr:DUF4229 domain-containing protein [Jatrophihabitans endophyticus]SHH20317.1 Protein of unknown function [Jatrophihabitans endophyticus]
MSDAAVGDARQQGPQQGAQPQFGRWMGSMWLYTALRFGLFFVLWGILLLVGLEALFAALVALVLSVPLSFVLLAKPRRAFTAQLEARVDAQRRRRADLDQQLDPEGHETDRD